jgi:DNA-binding transcriptional ArsR family regulator
MTFKDRLPHIDTPAALRALGHTTRLSILRRLQLDGPATATECALAVGQSPSSCSYHLRTLATHGFVDEVPSTDGRKRVWQATVSGFSFSSAGDVSADHTAAAALLRAAMMEIDDRLVHDYLVHEDEFPEAWREAALFANSTILVTPGELEELGRRIDELLAPYGRSARARRPRGSRLAHVLVYGVPHRR